MDTRLIKLSYRLRRLGIRHKYIKPDRLFPKGQLLVGHKGKFTLTILENGTIILCTIITFENPRKYKDIEMDNESQSAIEYACWW